MNAYNPVIRPEVGDVVMYRGCFGQAPAQRAVVTEVSTNKGRDCVSLDDGHWAYLTQIDAICDDAGVQP